MSERLVYSKQTLLDLLDLEDGQEDERFKKIETEHVGSRRWSQDYSTVIEDKQKGLFFCTSYSVGSTENQDERPYEFEENDIVVERVYPHKVEVIVFKDHP